MIAAENRLFCHYLLVLVKEIYEKGFSQERGCLYLRVFVGESERMVTGKAQFFINFLK